MADAAAWLFASAAARRQFVQQYGLRFGAMRDLVLLVGSREYVIRGGVVAEVCIQPVAALAAPVTRDLMPIAA